VAIFLGPLGGGPRAEALRFIGESTIIGAASDAFSPSTFIALLSEESSCFISVLWNPLPRFSIAIFSPSSSSPHFARLGDMATADFFGLAVGSFRLFGDGCDDFGDAASLEGLEADFLGDVALCILKALEEDELFIAFSFPNSFLARAGVAIPESEQTKKKKFNIGTTIMKTKS
jgi:hypothetical protein